MNILELVVVLFLVNGAAEMNLVGGNWTPDKTVKFSFPNGGNGAADLPLFINVIPAIFLIWMRLKTLTAENKCRNY